MLDKELIRKNFSRSAASYEKHAVLQKEMAERLFSMVRHLTPSRILDIGCGTGCLTRKLAERFPGAEVIGIDIAPGMIEVAVKNVPPVNLRYEIGDGEGLNFGQNSFDLVVSNASMQWMDAGLVLEGVAKVLAAGGHFAFTTFGPRTLGELKEAGFRVNAFLSEIELMAMAQAHFQVFQLDSRMTRQNFMSIKDLIYHLREIGSQSVDAGASPAPDAWKRKLNLRAPLEVSFEVISCDLALPSR